MGVNHRVVVLALPGVVTFDLGCALQVFAQPPGPPPQLPLYEVTLCTLGGGRVRTGDGFALVLEHGLEALHDADTVVVPGYAQWEEPPALAALHALEKAAGRGARVMSICVGAFALAHAGLLEGRRATTHWAAAPALQEAFPGVAVTTEALYVDEGPVLTSAGLAAGLDLGLHIVRRDHGARVAAQVARWNVIAPHREGTQAQFVPVPTSPLDGVGSLCAWVLDRLDQPLTLTQLAVYARCSERTLTRRFRAETGSTPKQWIARMRLDRARVLLESTDLTVEQIAVQTGFPAAAALRARVARELTTTPTAYRRAFGERSTDSPETSLPAPTPRDRASGAATRSHPAATRSHPAEQARVGVGASGPREVPHPPRGRSSVPT